MKMIFEPFAFLATATARLALGLASWAAMAAFFSGGLIAIAYVPAQFLPEDWRFGVLVACGFLGFFIEEAYRNRHTKSVEEEARRGRGLDATQKGA